MWTRGPSNKIDDLVTAKLDELKRLRPEIEAITPTVQTDDLGGKAGVVYEIKLTGAVLFKPGRKSSI